MGKIRVQFSGLCAFVVDDDDSDPGKVSRVSVVFADPWAFGLHPHRPKLIVDAGIVTQTSLSGTPTAAGQEFDLSGWDISLLVNEKFPKDEVIAVPEEDEIDPEDANKQRVLSGISKIIDIGRACGEPHFNRSLLKNPPPKEIVGRLRLNRGKLQTFSNAIGKFVEWSFVDGLREVHRQAVSDIVVWRDDTGAAEDQTLLVALQSMSSVSDVGTIRLSCKANVTTWITIRHDCDVKECGPHVGKHVAMFYDLTVGPHRRPSPRHPATEGGYCPPGSFVI